MPCGSPPTGISVIDENVPSPAPSRIQTLWLDVADDAEIEIAVVVEVGRRVRARLDADVLRRQHRLIQAAAVGAIEEDAHVGADLVDGGEIEVAVVVEVGGGGAVDARLRAGDAVRERRQLLKLAALATTAVRNWKA